MVDVIGLIFLSAVFLLVIVFIGIKIYKKGIFTTTVSEKLLNLVETLYQRISQEVALIVKDIDLCDITDEKIEELALEIIFKIKDEFRDRYELIIKAFSVVESDFDHVREAVNKATFSEYDESKVDNILYNLTLSFLKEKLEV